ncbi:hypothetical protein [Candidatus Mycoplasma haematohominis]|uniref:Uncharacterized protein n=1 Tax=Candidatus Mycoplasma haematohominis TaxID=1494318 RepID=A0A478FQA8_9MOLU|nr:hypothetical protein [Candidatus Mycoplasma haemohominis]GCE63084.1 hypothetical protein MHSWG343_00620 [Candidatus Mycoplasma haemohominis]
MASPGAVVVAGVLGAGAIGAGSVGTYYVINGTGESKKATTPDLSTNEKQKPVTELPKQPSSTGTNEVSGGANVKLQTQDTNTGLNEKTVGRVVSEASQGSVLPESSSRGDAADSNIQPSTPASVEANNLGTERDSQS